MIIAGTRLVGGTYQDTPSGLVTSGLILNLDAGNPASYPGTGTTWFDLSPSGYDATISGATYNSGSGGYFDFDGTDSVDCGNITNIGASSTEFSVEIWFNSDTAATRSLIQNGTDFNTNTYYLWQQNATELVFEVWGGSSFDAVTFSDAPDYSTGQWYQLVGVWTAGQRAKLYRNADASLNTPWLTGSIQNQTVTGNTNTIVGQRGGSFGFDGKIPIIRLYDRALSEAEVLRNFNADRSRFGL